MNSIRTRFEDNINVCLVTEILALLAEILQQNLSVQVSQFI